MNGRFYVFDGMDGSGKSTAMKSVADRLQQHGLDVLCTREPGGSPVAEAIRACLLRDWERAMPVETELLLVFAARAAHMQQTVMPALAAGRVVLCDRFIDSSHVYQGCIGGADPQWIDSLYARTVTRQPDQIFLFDLDVDVAMTRMQQRASSDRFDRQGRAVLQRMREAYLQRAQLPGRCRVNADQSPQQLADALSARILEQLA